MRNPALLLTVASCLAVSAAFAEIKIDADFPGGNIIVDKIDGDTVLLRPDLRDTQGGWFYWCFRIRGVEAGRTLTFKFTQQSPIGVRGPAISTDGGVTWRWLSSGENGAVKKVDPTTFSHTFAAGQDDARFGFGMTYTQSHFDAFLKKVGKRPELRMEKLCETKKGRAVERLHLGKIDGEPRYRVLLTARHHACEMMASYSIEGIIESILADDADGAWWRQNVEAMCVPFVDKDGVEDGDQGKNRKPRDHNRDYDNQSVHRETAALREFVPKWSGGKLVLAVDLHCPHIRGAHNEVIYQVGRQEPRHWAQQQALGQILEKVQKGPLVYRQSDDLPFGKSWNTGANYGQGTSVGRWAGALEGIKLATGLEIPYANAAGREVTQESARLLGRDLAAAMKAWLEK